MKYTLLETHKELPRDFYIYKKKVFYKKEYNIYEINNEKSLFLKKNTFVNILDLKKQFLYYISNAIMYKHNLENNKIIKTLLPKDSLLQIKNILENGYVIRYKKKNENWKIRYLDLEGVTIWELDNDKYFNSLVVKNNFIVNSLEGKYLTNYDMIDLKPKWHHSYSGLFGREYKGGGPLKMMHINGKLYVCFGRTTFCIDIERGKVEHRYEDYFRVDERNFIYGLKPTPHNTEFYITTLNTQTNEIERIDILDELKRYNIYLDEQFAVQDGLVYFKQSMGSDVARIGVISPNQGKVLWKYDLPKGSGQVGGIKVQGNRIYAHTQDFTLHIFEKE